MHATLRSIVVSLSAVISSAAADELLLDPALPYTAERSSSVTYDVDYSIIVTPPYKTKRLRVWVPVPPSNVGQEVSEHRWSTFPTVVAPQVNDEPKYGNRFAYFEFASPQGAQVIRQRLKVKVWELRWRVEADRVSPVAEWPASFEPYRRSESQAIVVGPQHLELSAELVPRRLSEPLELSAVMDYARKKFRYDHGTASLVADSTHALRTGAGHCSDYHGFCAAVGRALGYPTRITYGINTFPKASPSHCKLEAFLPPYGWVSFDVSETQKLTAAIDADATLDATAKRRLVAAALDQLRSGFRDNMWYLQTVGSDYDLVPAAARRVPVVRTIYAEADGVALPDPDPSDPTETKFAWMTTARFTPDREVTYPFADVKSLE
jgi:transglutaminase-like putative cysteine protease